ncbi:hypothetical protein [Chryseobacterium sp. BIGb0232]|uniref:hypothetical protein n=1 Tax=Chryseobacterium sp. BIGb0232 TaxID=2940598 RepID=UPI000F469D3E|nr:hypothetical protein [Chryseobacterium sp. BIGb0232]MCS4302647.1 hypothetical protein [Chryseobacterium sp. BIGb0232]ROS17301.1 hypothetical protein EDF65_1665 [Chryseobacterium nakagawai]
MKNLITILLLLLFSIFHSQIKCDKLGEITENIINLYVKDTLKTSFKSGDFIAVSVFSDSISNKNSLYIETIEKDFKLYKNTPNYRWFTVGGKKMIIFCGLGSNDRCNNYFETLNFKRKEDNIELLDISTSSYELDGEIKLWKLLLNKNYKIISVNGKVIESEISNPRDFKIFLKKYSNLKLYQMVENGIIVYPKPNK